MEKENLCIRLIDLELRQTNQPASTTLNLGIKNGSLVALTGRQSSYWTPLMRLIAGQQPVLAGQLELWGTPISQIGRRDLAARVCYYSQQQQQSMVCLVYDFILEGSQAWLKPLQGPGEAEQKEVARIIRLLAIENLVNRDFSRLKGSDRLRVLLARAQMQRARLVLLDQPFEDLPETGRAELATWLLRMARSENMTILISMTDSDLALRIADQLVIFDTDGTAGAYNKQNGQFPREIFNHLDCISIPGAEHVFDLLPSDPESDNRGTPGPDSRERDERLF